MASAEQLLNEAQYAFQSITVGDSRENRRNAARAKSLCQKIFRKYPGTSEAVVAHGIMMRLGEVVPEPGAYAGYEADSQLQVTEVAAQQPGPGESVPLDWSGLMAIVLGTPKSVLAIIAIGGIILFSIFGMLLFLPLIALAFLTSPFRQTLKPDQRRQINELVVRANAWIDDRRKSGRGLA